MELEDRVRGAMWGLLIGDALGVPYEFHPPADIPPQPQVEFTPPPWFQRAHAGTPPGTWSDDGAHALCLLASLLERGQLDTTDLMRRLSAWFDDGYLAVDARPYDVGIQTSTALMRFARGAPAEGSGPDGERDNGNGSLMRVLPLALWHVGDDDALIHDAMRQSIITHGHLRSQLCCALYCLWVRRTLASAANPWADALATLRRRFPVGTPEHTELEQHIRPDVRGGTGSGYAVDCLRSARWAIEQGSYEDAVRAAISLGHDTDTTAAVAGGLAGARDGLAAIPPRWMDDLRGRALAEALITQLVQHLIA